MSGMSGMSMDMGTPATMSSSITSLLSTISSMSSIPQMSSMSNMIMSSGSSLSSSMGSAMSDMNMAVSATTTATAAPSMSNMIMSTASASVTSAMSGMDMSSSNDSMGMDMDMGMNYYLTRHYKYYPVLFEKLYAKDKKGAFGIFVLILVAAFVYKLINFTNWCLEVHWFKKWNKEENKFASGNDNEKFRDDDSLNSDSTQYSDMNGISLREPIPQLPNLFNEIFAPNCINLCHDFIRIILVFVSTMIIYMLMLAAMSFVLTYVFAVITGLTLSEVFFNRCKMALLKRWEIQRTIERINKCPGGTRCQCGKHKKSTNSINNTNVADTKSVDGDNELDGCGNNCKCDHEAKEQERDIERNILESNKLQEQSNDMDANLLPAEKYK